MLCTYTAHTWFGLEFCARNVDNISIVYKLISIKSNERVFFIWIPFILLVLLYFLQKLKNPWKLQLRMSYAIANICHKYKLHIMKLITCIRSKGSQWRHLLNDTLTNKQAAVTMIFFTMYCCINEINARPTKKGWKKKITTKKATNKNQNQCQWANHWTDVIKIVIIIYEMIAFLLYHGRIQPWILPM